MIALEATATGAPLNQIEKIQLISDWATGRLTPFPLREIWINSSALSDRGEFHFIFSVSPRVCVEFERFYEFLRHASQLASPYTTPQQTILLVARDSLSPQQLIKIQPLVDEWAPHLLWNDLRDENGILLQTSVKLAELVCARQLQRNVLSDVKGSTTVTRHRPTGAPFVRVWSEEQPHARVSCFLQQDDVAERANAEPHVETARRLFRVLLNSGRTFSSQTEVLAWLEQYEDVSTPPQLIRFVVESLKPNNEVNESSNRTMSFEFVVTLASLFALTMYHDQPPPADDVHTFIQRSVISLVNSANGSAETRQVAVDHAREIVQRLVRPDRKSVV